MTRFSYVTPSFSRKPSAFLLSLLSMEMPIWISNVLLVCERCNQAARTGARHLDDGTKERYCKKCGAGIGQIGPTKTRKAKK